MKIPTAQIQPAVRNDRQDFDARDLAKLADSIKATGQLQAAVVYQIAPGRYQLVAGERRHRACQLTGLDLECTVVDKPADPETSSIGTWAENFVRVNLNPLEEAQGIADRMNRFGWSIDQACDKLGIRVDVVTNRLALLRLTPTIAEHVAKGHVGVSYGAAMAGLGPARQQIALNRLQANPSPTITWFRRECGALEQQQATDVFGGLFDTGAYEVETVPETIARPPLPSETQAPTTGDSPLAIVNGQIAYWLGAAEAWSALGHNKEARECRGAANSLRGLVTVLEVSSPKDELLTSEEAATLLGCSRSNIRQMVHVGRLTGRMVMNQRMFTRSELESIRKG